MLAYILQPACVTDLVGPAMVCAVPN